MASKTPKSKKPTVREQIERKSGDKPKARIRRPGTSRLKAPLSKAKKVGKKEYHLPMPDNKLGKILSKRARFIPSYFRESWTEIKQVTWPNRKETVRLTTAVFIFSVVFGVVVALLDVALDKIFKEIIIK